MRVCVHCRIIPTVVNMDSHFMMLNTLFVNKNKSEELLVGYCRLWPKITSLTLWSWVWLVQCLSSFNHWYSQASSYTMSCLVWATAWIQLNCANPDSSDDNADNAPSNEGSTALVGEVISSDSSVEVTSTEWGHQEGQGKGAMVAVASLGAMEMLAGVIQYPPSSVLLTIQWWRT